MASVPIEFPFSEKRTRHGLLPDPRIPVFVQTRHGYLAYRFLLDTGADFSMVPFSMAEDLGIDVTRCPTDQCSGIEGRPLFVYHAGIGIRIGDVDLPLRCLISESDTTPFLLGRADLFTHFTITFDYHHKTISFTHL